MVSCKLSSGDDHITLGLVNWGYETVFMSVFHVGVYNAKKKEA